MVAGGGRGKVVPLTNERQVVGGFRGGGAAVFEKGRPDDTPFDVDHHGIGDEQKGSKNKHQVIAEVKIVDTLPFNLWVTLTVLLNILLFGLDQDLRPDDTQNALDSIFWYMVECIFAGIFVIELIVRINVERKAFFDDVWNLLDMVIIIAAVVDALILAPIGIGGQARYFTVLRGLRAVKLVRLVQMFPAFRELWLLVGGLVNSLKALGWVGIIVLVVLYVCGIVVTEEIGKNDEVYGTGPSYDGEVWPHEKYFGTVWRSMFTLFQVLTLDSWCDGIVRHVVYRQPHMGVFFVIFLLLSAFGLMNVVVGIIVENTLVAAQVTDRRVEEHNAQQRKAAVDSLAEILDKSDVKRLGEITMEELKAANNSKIVQERFEKIGMTFEEVEEIFRLLDFENNGRVELKRLAASCHELVGGAKRRDIAQVEVTVGTLAYHLDTLDGKFSVIETEVNGLSQMADEFIKTTMRLLTGFDGSQQPQYQR